MKLHYQSFHLLSQHLDKIIPMLNGSFLPPPLSLQVNTFNILVTSDWFLLPQMTSFSFSTRQSTLETIEILHWQIPSNHLCCLPPVNGFPAYKMNTNSLNVICRFKIYTKFIPIQTKLAMPKLQVVSAMVNILMINTHRTLTTPRSHCTET